MNCGSSASALTRRPGSWHGRIPGDGSVHIIANEPDEYRPALEMD
jgi:hypothetical protein